MAIVKSASLSAIPRWHSWNILGRDAQVGLLKINQDSA